MKHGQYNKEENAVWCEVDQQYHGPLYLCEHYPTEVLTRIRKMIDEWRNDLQDPDWIAKQRDRGVPEEVIQIHKWFAGIN